ncbi:unnamed protein product, partial [Ectocarpus fasciculatus]
MSDTSDSSGMHKKKSFSSRFSSKMDKISNPFKRGDHSDSDSDDDDGSGSGSGGGKGKSLFGGKLHNPFKKGHGSDSEDESSSRSPAKGRRKSSAGAAATTTPKPSGGVVPAMPSLFAKSPKKHEQAPTEEENPAAQIVVPQPAPVPDPEPPAAPAAAAAAAVAAPALPPRTPAEAPRAAAAKPAPKKPRVTVGGPVFGAPDILLTGVKGEPDAAMRTLRQRGFIIHLSMLHEEQVPPAITMVLAMGPKLLVKSAVERNLATKSRQDYTSGEVAQLCADAVHVIKRSGLEYEEA